MKIVIAPDSYKGAMRAGQVAAAIAEGWRSIRQDDEIVLLPLSDGGEGLCEVLTRGSGGEFVRIETVDALMRQKSARVGISGDTAVIESAEANGIEHLAATLVTVVIKIRIIAHTEPRGFAVCVLAIFTIYIAKVITALIFASRDRLAALIANVILISIYVVRDVRNVAVIASMAAVSRIHMVGFL